MSFIIVIIFFFMAEDTQVQESKMRVGSKETELFLVAKEAIGCFILMLLFVFMNA